MATKGKRLQVLNANELPKGLGGKIIPLGIGFVVLVVVVIAVVALRGLSVASGRELASESVTVAPDQFHAAVVEITEAGTCMLDITPSGKPAQWVLMRKGGDATIKPEEVKFVFPNAKRAPADLKTHREEPVTQGLYLYAVYNTNSEPLDVAIRVRFKAASEESSR